MAQISHASCPLDEEIQVGDDDIDVTSAADDGTSSGVEFELRSHNSLFAAFVSKTGARVSHNPCPPLPRHI